MLFLQSPHECFRRERVSVHGVFEARDVPGFIRRWDVVAMRAYDSSVAFNNELTIKVRTPHIFFAPQRTLWAEVVSVDLFLESGATMPGLTITTDDNRYEVSSENVSAVADYDAAEMASGLTQWRHAIQAIMPEGVAGFFAQIEISLLVESLNGVKFWGLSQNVVPRVQVGPDVAASVGTLGFGWS